MVICLVSDFFNEVNIQLVDKYCKNIDKVLFIPTSNNVEETLGYCNQTIAVFNKVLNKELSFEIFHKDAIVDNKTLVFLMGGNTVFQNQLINNNKDTIMKMIMNSSKVVFGWSAGAFNLGGSYKLKYKGDEIFNGLGLYDFSIDVHVNDKFKELNEQFYSENSDFLRYLIYDDGAIVIDKDITLIGNVELWNKI